ncbi:uncharacterized protein N7529_004989 [Penicillium soppii]|uniref:uncharacterized protein n=1 Tax=Penicillium soppii TaxID=69789 RepID=UPI0025490955|nr:uncharacterized protein N7529_004989 [Penicillium soppii]KAJ5872636.1 hypothetical protein N7529_004989 [Penicillium soppii]
MSLAVGASTYRKNHRSVDKGIVKRITRRHQCSRKMRLGSPSFARLFRLGNNNRRGLDIDMGYIRPTGSNHDGRRKFSTVKVGQLTGGADANGGAANNAP